MTIPIQNVYYLLCFAWRYAPQELAFDVGAIPASSDVLDLCSYVLISGVDRLLRRGLDRGYTVLVEETAVLRGRIEFTPTIKQRRHATIRAVCSHDDLTANVLHNQIIRSSLAVLMRAEGVSHDLRDGLRTTFSRLAGVDTLRVDASHFARVQLNRNNRYYGFLLSICRLVHSLLLPDESHAGTTQFSDLIADEARMARVFEEFLRNFYKLKLDEFSEVDRETLKWGATATVPGDLEILPQMHTDITMRSSTRTVIVDAKYYRDALQEHHGTKKAHSDNLYQLLAYLRAEELRNSAIVPEGVLIYPVAENSIDASFVIDGYPVRLFTLNLNQRWDAIETELLSLFPSKELGAAYDEVGAI